jgi:hypothetical protein
MKRFTHTLLFLLGLVLLLFVAAPAFAQVQTKTDRLGSARLVIDGDDADQVLFQKIWKEPRPLVALEVAWERPTAIDADSTVLYVEVLVSGPPKGSGTDLWTSEHDGGTTNGWVLFHSSAGILAWSNTGGTIACDGADPTSVGRHLDFAQGGSLRFVPSDAAPAGGATGWEDHVSISMEHPVYGVRVRYDTGLGVITDDTGELKFQFYATYVGK